MTHFWHSLPITRTLSETELAENWTLWRERRDISARNNLVLHYWGRVAWPIIRRLEDRLGRVAPRGSFVADAFHGMVSALESFDPTRRVKFATYARRRVDGAIRDGQRGDDPMTRRQREHCEAGAVGRFVSLSGMADRVRGDTEGDFVPDRGRGPLETALYAEFWAAWRRLLGARRFRIVKSIYCDGLSQADVARRMGKSESWVSQLHRQALGLLGEWAERHGVRGAA